MVHSMNTTLIHLAASPNFENQIQNIHVNGIVGESMDIIAFLTNEKDFQYFFTQNSFKLFIQVIVPLLKLSEKEREDIDENPKEFVNYSIDVCQKQKSKTYKT